MCKKKNGFVSPKQWSTYAPQTEKRAVTISSNGPLSSLFPLTSYFFPLTS